MMPSNFRIRAITAAVFLVLMVGSILLGPEYFAFLMLLVFNLGLTEFYKLISPPASLQARITGQISGTLIFMLIYGFNADWFSDSDLFYIIPMLLILPFIMAMFDKYFYAVAGIGTTLAGIIFLALPLSLFSSLYILGESFVTVRGDYFLLMILIILWVYDTVAYIFGSWFGVHALFRRLSPGKTWEGSLGGMVFGLATAFVISGYFPEIKMIHWLAMAMIIMVFGTLGDLCESMLKRNAGVKDSGNLLPGHGGILDRFDALLFTAPALYLYMMLFVIEKN